MAHRYLVWVEIEEVNDEGDHVRDWSLDYLEGPALGEFTSVEEAGRFGNLVQQMGRSLGGGLRWEP